MTEHINQEIQGVLDSNGTFRVSHATVVLFVIRPQDWVIQRVASVKHRHWIAWDFYRERGIHRYRVERLAPDDTQGFVLYDAHGALAKMSVRIAEPHHLTLELQALRADVNRVGFRWRSSSDENFYGFGEYGDGPRRTGRWTTWTEEGPVGLGPLSRLLRWTGHVPLPKGYRSTYAPSPSWLSSHLYAAWLLNTERIDWYIGTVRRRVRVWSQSLALHLVVGTTLREVIGRRGALLGTPPLPPPWVFAPWNDAVQGEDNVQALVRLLRNGKIPSSVIWIEDWTGSWQDTNRFRMRPLSHQISTRLYPHLAEMAESLHRQGFKLLGYFCPEIALDTDLYREALAGGHLVCNNLGNPVTINILGHLHGELDLTRPETRQWIKERMWEPLEHIGFDGWMADFGEYLPVGSRLADGSGGWETHNRYPTLWQTLHREFWDKKRPDGDYTFFVRSAALRTPSIAPVMWGGDSDTDFDIADGLPAVVPQALSAGLTGNTIWGTDIAGYMSFGLTPPSTKELYIRWLELAALLPIMRTHHGTAAPRNWHFSRDGETLAIYTRYARLHMLLFPYFYTLASLSHESGLPLVRPLFLHDNVNRIPHENREFLLGPDILVAPVISPRKRQWRVNFPCGDWIDWWTGDRYKGPGSHRIDAPLDRLPLFIRCHRIIALAEGQWSEDMPTPPGFVQTLVRNREVTDDIQSVCDYVTLIMIGLVTVPGEVILPSGRLRWEPNDVRSEEGDFEPQSVTGARYTHHAPFLQYRGQAYHLPGHGHQQTPDLRMHWDGTDHLWVSIRRINESKDFHPISANYPV